MDMQNLINKVRFRLDDIDTSDYEYDDDYIQGHIQNNLDSYGHELPLESKQDEQIIVIETMIDIVTALKFWADGESYSYKNDAIQLSRGLQPKHYLDTIRILQDERNEILEGNGGFY